MFIFRTLSEGVILWICIFIYVCICDRVDLFGIYLLRSKRQMEFWLHRLSASSLCIRAPSLYRKHCKCTVQCATTFIACVRCTYAGGSKEFLLFTFDGDFSWFYFMLYSWLHIVRSAVTLSGSWGCRFLIHIVWLRFFSRAFLCDAIYDAYFLLLLLCGKIFVFAWIL